MPDADAGSSESHLEEVYDQLRAIAGRMFTGVPAGHTLQPTAIVHEAYLKLAGGEAWETEAHFLAVAAKAVRHVLVDHYRGSSRAKRGSGAPVYSLDTTIIDVGAAAASPLEIDELLRRLAGEDQRSADVVEMKFFGGMTTEQIAHRLNVSEATVQRDWRFARAWLHTELSGHDGPAP